MTIGGITAGVRGAKKRGLCIMRFLRTPVGMASAIEVDGYGLLVPLIIVLTDHNGAADTTGAYVAAMFVKIVEKAAKAAGGPSCKINVYLDGPRADTKEARNQRGADGQAKAGALDVAVRKLWEYARTNALWTILEVPADAEYAVVAALVLNRDHIGFTIDGDAQQYLTASENVARVQLWKYDASEAQALDMPKLLKHMAGLRAFDTSDEQARFRPRRAPGTALSCLVLSVVALLTGDYFKHTTPRGVGDVALMSLAEHVATLAETRMRAMFTKADLPEVWPLECVIGALTTVLLQQQVHHAYVLRHADGAVMTAAARGRHVRKTVAVQVARVTVAWSQPEQKYRLVVLQQSFSTRTRPCWLRERVTPLAEVETQLQALDLVGRTALESLSEFFPGGFAALKALETRGFVPREVLSAATRPLSGFALLPISEILRLNPRLDVLGVPPSALPTTLRHLAFCSAEGMASVCPWTGAILITMRMNLQLSVSHVGKPVAVRFNFKNMSIEAGVMGALDSPFMQLVFVKSLREALESGNSLPGIALYALGGAGMTRRSAAAHAGELPPPPLVPPEADEDAEREGLHDDDDAMEQAEDAEAAGSGGDSDGGSGSAAAADGEPPAQRRKLLDDDLDDADDADEDATARLGARCACPDGRQAVDWTPLDLREYVASGGASGYPTKSQNERGLAAYLEAATPPPGAPPLAEVRTFVLRLPADASAEKVQAARAQMAAAAAAEAQAAAARSAAAHQRVLAPRNIGSSLLNKVMAGGGAGRGGGRGKGRGGGPPA